MKAGVRQFQRCWNPRRLIANQAWSSGNATTWLSETAWFIRSGLEVERVRRNVTRDPGQAGHRLRVRLPGYRDGPNASRSIITVTPASGTMAEAGMRIPLRHLVTAGFFVAPHTRNTT